jgi:hypothetical protein
MNVACVSSVAFYMFKETNNRSNEFSKKAISSGMMIERKRESIDDHLAPPVLRLPVFSPLQMKQI